MPLSTFFIDLDDTVYPHSCGIWNMIKDRINLYMIERMHLPPAEVPQLRRELFTKYGTTMRGLQALFGIDAEDYLAYVHDVPVEAAIHPDVKLREVLRSYPQPKVIFTNADTRHAERVLQALEIRNCFTQIVDIHHIAPACKPQPEAFQTALKSVGWPNPHDCLLADDAASNLTVAKDLGFFTIQVAPTPASEVAHRSISSLAELPLVVPVDMSW